MRVSEYVGVSERDNDLEQDFEEVCKKYIEVLIVHILGRNYLQQWVEYVSCQVATVVARV